MVEIEIGAGKTARRGYGLDEIAIVPSRRTRDASEVDIEIELAPRMIVLRYDDVPGVIGRVGTLLGEAGVNIANMAVSRNRDAGKALMVLSLDTPAAPEVLARLGEGVDDAFVVPAELG